MTSLRVSWGSKAIDSTIGEIEGGVMYLFYGPTGAGKTTLSTYVPAARIAGERGIDRDERIVVIDIDGGFDLKRFETVLRSNGLDPAAVLGKVMYVNVTEFNEQHELIKDLDERLKKAGAKPVMVSVDPMTAIYRGIILRTDLKFRASVIGTYTGKLDLQLVTLRHIAVTYDCPVFLTTWPASKVGEALGGGQPELPFIGGRQMGFLPKVIAEVVIPDRYSPRRRLKLFKSRHLPPGLECEFRLSDRGVEDV